MVWLVVDMSNQGSIVYAKFLHLSEKLSEDALSVVEGFFNIPFERFL